MSHRQKVPGSLSRKPPAAVRHFLAKEVNFGCPVDGCGSPFLTWHHFDPPWKRKHHHNKGGMIALCAEHACHADGSLWTVEQQREMKRKPYLTDVVTAVWPWAPENVVFVLGGSIFIGARAALRLRGEEVVAARRIVLPGANVPSARFNMSLRDSSGKQFLSMQDNLLCFGVDELQRVTCPPRAREFALKHKTGTAIHLVHWRCLPDEFVDTWLAKQFDFSTRDTTIKEIRRSALDSEGRVSVVQISCRLKSGEIELHTTNEKIELIALGMPSTLSPRVFDLKGRLRINQEGRELVGFG